ncbi:MAG TPA: hypothetical protein PKW90_17190 [Myxococcota bacterium]|nr:hypothetical protein [Myxococcota bacterium]
MAIKTETFSAESELRAFCNGGIRGGFGRGKFDLDGLVLKFSQPSAFTCTFSGNQLSLNQISDQLMTASADTVKAVLIRDCLWLIEVTPTNGVTIKSTAAAGAPQPAKTILGFSLTPTIAGTVLDVEGGTPPRRISAAKRPQGDWVLTWESA